MRALIADRVLCGSGRDKMDDIIPPGASWTFVWQVTERAGPGPSDPSSLLWMYHSHFNEVADTNAGLSGPIIISRKARPRSASSHTASARKRAHAPCTDHACMHFSSR